MLLRRQFDGRVYRLTSGSAATRPNSVGRNYAGSSADAEVSVEAMDAVTDY